MDPDSAELASVMSVVADLGQRVGDVARRRSTDPDDPLPGRLHEIERSLETAARRLRAAIRELD